MFKRPKACELIEELYRTSRKYRTSLLTLSQSLEDFERSPIASALLANSATRYVLRHRSGHDALAERLHLTERGTAAFRSLTMRRGEYSEFLLQCGQNHQVVVRLALSPLEYWTTTTHPADLAHLDALASAHPDLSLFQRLELAATEAPKGAWAVEARP